MGREGDWRKRRALEVVSQLPEDPEDAMKVLKLAEVLLKSWLTDDEPYDTGLVVPLRGGAKFPSA
jgi:hypothetical protein